MNNVGQMFLVTVFLILAVAPQAVNIFIGSSKKDRPFDPYVPYCSPGIPLEFLTTPGSAAIFTVWHEDIILPNDYLGEV